MGICQRLVSQQTAVRLTKKARILELFKEHIGQEFSSNNLHATFGSAFRTRVSEINLDPSSPVRILNRSMPSGDSVYWAVGKTV